MKLKVFTKIGIGVASIFVIVMIYLLLGWDKKQPQLNPEPNYFVTIHGHVASALSHKISIVFQQRFVGNNSKCTYVLNRLEGIKANPVKLVNYQLKISKNGSYSIKIPTDKYVFGYCGWHASSLGLSLTNTPNNLMVQTLIDYGASTHSIPVYSSASFLHMLQSNKANNNLNTLSIKCPDNANDCIFNVYLPLKYKIDKSYNLKINFSYKDQGDHHA